MELPNIRTVLMDTAKKIRYEVVAFRALTQAELVGAVRYFLSTQRKKPTRNSCVQIVTIIGWNE